MLISHYVANVQSDLVRLGELGGEDLATTSDRLAGALEPALRGRLFEALNQVLAEANEASPSLRLEIRLAGDELTIVRNETDAAPTDVPGDLNARFALRLPEELKSLIDDRADRAGASTNSWIIRALSKELSENISRNVNKPGKHLRGTGHS